MGTAIKGVSMKRKLSFLAVLTAMLGIFVVPATAAQAGIPPEPGCFYGANLHLGQAQLQW